MKYENLDPGLITDLFRQFCTFNDFNKKEGIERTVFEDSILRWEGEENFNLFHEKQRIQEAVQNTLDKKMFGLYEKEGKVYSNQ